MKTPAFWNKKNLTARVLWPVGKIYSSLTALRLKIKKPQKVNVPVICIGNLTAGGSGKTPVCEAMSVLLKQCGFKPAFVSRGYGGSLSGVMVDNTKNTAQEVGDEPLLLARNAPVSIHPNRYLAAQKAIENGADILVMDDGFQNPGLFKDVSFLVFDGAFGIGNSYPVPAGPMRENFGAGIKRAHAAIIIGKDKYNIASKLGKMPVFQAQIVSELPTLTTDKVIAFAGIGRPEKFYNSLREYNLDLVEMIDFPDHHYYSDEEVKELIDKAWLKDAELVTTAKDFVKIPIEMRHHFKVLEIKIVWNDEHKFKRFINKVLTQK